MIVLMGLATLSIDVLPGPKTRYANIEGQWVIPSSVAPQVPRIVEDYGRDSNFISLNPYSAVLLSLLFLPVETRKTTMCIRTVC
jgi:hypothetical protein